MSQIAIRDPHEPRTSINEVQFGESTGGARLTPQNLGDIVRFADVMAKADIAIPKHLRGNPGACLAVCMQAMKWEMDPFSVAQKSYKVGDQMAYEAQLIAAVINTRAGLRRRPAIEYEGQDRDRICVVTFEALDGSIHVYRSPRFEAITTKNSPLWKSDPDQQLAYYSVRAGARRHFPEVILGVYDRDELDGPRDVTPATSRSSFAARIAAQPQQQVTDAREGFDADFIDAELTARPAPQAEPTSSTLAQPNGMHETIAATADDLFPGDVDPDAPAVDHEAALERQAETRQDDRTASAPNHDPVLRSKLVECAAKFLQVASGEGEPAERQAIIKQYAPIWKDELPDNYDDLNKIVQRSNAVVTGKLNLPAAVTMLAAELGLKEADIRPVTR